VARTFSYLASSDDLRAKIDSAAKALDEESEESEEIEDSLFSAVLNLVHHNEKIVSDLKVSFDTENFECADGKGYNGAETLTGFRITTTGLRFLGCSAGGDWEVPVFFIIYWDGSRLRAYVPTDGNTWNTDTKMAYGNDARADFENAKKRYPDLAADFEAQVAKHAEEMKKLDVILLLRAGYDSFDFDTHDLPECDPDAIIDDIIARIQPKSGIGDDLNPTITNMRDEDFTPALPIPPICDGIRVTTTKTFITVQTTQQGIVKGAGLMLTRDMALALAQKLVDAAS